jgi:hypothetical protein
MRCKAYTVQGKRCKNTAKENCMLCHVHTTISEKAPTIDDFKNKLINFTRSYDPKKDDGYDFWSNNRKLINKIDTNLEYESKKIYNKYSYFFKDLQYSSDTGFFTRMKDTINVQLSKVNKKNVKLIDFSIFDCCIDIVTIIIFFNNRDIFSLRRYLDAIETVRRLVSLKNNLKASWEEQNMNKLRIKTLCKMPFIADDICKYVIAQYL